MPDFPTDPREDWKAKVTAQIFGELPPEEAEIVRRQIARDPALAEWKAQLELTMGLVKESFQNPTEPGSTQSQRLRLSEAKRDQLLAHFKTIKAKELTQPKIDVARWVVWSCAFACALILTTMLLPALGHAKQKAQRVSIVNNLKMLRTAKQIWAEENGKADGDTPKPDDLISYLGGSPTRSIEGERYVLGPVGKAPVALTKHGAIRLPGDDESIPSKVSDLAAGRAIAPAMTPPEQPVQQIAAYKPPGNAPPADEKTIKAKYADASDIRDALEKLGQAQQQTTTSLDTASSPMLGDAPVAGRQYVASGPSADGGFGGLGLLSKDRGGQLGLEPPPPASAPVGAVESDLIARLEATRRIKALDGQEAFVPPSTDVVGNRSAVSNSENTESESTNAFSLNAVGYINVATTNSITITDQLSTSTANSASGVTDKSEQLDEALKRAPAHLPAPQPEIKTADNAFSTFSLNVSDASFRLAAATLEKGQMPGPGAIRSEEFLNAFDYRDPEPAPGVKVSFAWERCANPFAHDRDFLRFSLKTAAEGREASRPLNLVLLLDKSGSMERADRVAITDKMLETLATQLHPHDTLSVVVFARTARLWADGVSGDKATDTFKSIANITPQGGTDLEDAMRVAYQTAVRHYQPAGENRVVLLTDGAANLGEVDPVSLKKNVETNRAQGIAFDCFGIGWEGYNDELLATLSRSGGGRYGFINTPEEASTEFAGQLAGALRVAAYDVKTQVEFNPKRVTLYRQIGYAQDQLTKEQFRDNSVKAAQLGAAESGNALYVAQINPSGDGPLCTVRVRYRLPDSNEYREQEWPVPYTGTSAALENSNPAMRLAASTSSFSEWLQNSPYAGEVKLNSLLRDLNGVPQTFGADPRPKLLETMIQEARSISGK